MKDLFRGYIKKSEEDLEKLWKNATFVFDTNILLNLYRYSVDTSNSILELIEYLSDRIFLPHHAAFEFNKNRFEVISEQEKTFADFAKKINEIETEIDSKSKHPFLSKKLNSEIKNVFEKIKKELESNIETYNNLSKTDPIFEKICILFKDKISDQFENDKLKEIYSQGEQRFDLKIPPGYEDRGKNENKFGDLILWMQIIEISRIHNKKSIILITDEKKTDWIWKLKNGKTIGPRPELIEEIYKETQCNFHIFSSERFLTLGKKYSQITPAPEAINEIEAYKNKTDKYAKYNIYNFNVYDKIKTTESSYNYIKKLEQRYNAENENLNILTHEASVLDDKIKKSVRLYEDIKKDGAEEETINMMAEQIRKLETKSDNIRMALEQTKLNIAVLDHQFFNLRSSNSKSED